MPRKNVSRIHDFYEYIDGRSICQVTDIAGNVCQVPVKGRHAGNLEKHVYRNHEAVWNDYYHNFKLPLLAKEDSFTPPPSKRPKVLPEYVKVTDTALDNMNFTYRNLEKACITMATVDGRPLSFVDDVGFRMILDPLLNIMNPIKKKDYPSFAINKNRLQKLIKEEAENIKYEIIKKISGKLISLKIDCACILGKNFLCSSIFLKENSNACVYTLPLIEIQDIANQEAIKAVILDNLASYEVTSEQIYSVIVDNTVNILSSTDLLKDENIDEMFFEEPKEENHDNENSTSNNDSDFDTYVIEVDYENASYEHVSTNPNEHNSTTLNNAQLNDNPSKCEEFINAVMEIYNNEVHCLICPSHTFQLIVKEATSDPVWVEIIPKIRDLIKKCKTPEYSRELYTHCRKKLILDNPDRWISTYDMLHKLLTLKPHLKKINLPKDLFISASLWKQVEEYVTAYGPIRTALYTLHQENVPLSEFFKIWTTCYLKTKKIGSQWTNTLCQLMEKEQKLFFQNILFISCIYLDPRFKNILEEEYVSSIVEHLSELYIKINSQKSNDSDNYEIDFVDITDIKVEPDSLSESVDCDRNAEDLDVENFIKSMIKSPSAPENPFQVKEKIQNLLKTFFESEPLLGVKENVLKFWHDKRYAYPELYKIAQIVFAVPASHYSVNKMCSQMKYLFNPYFTVSLGLPVVNDILMVRVNSDVAKFK